MSAGVGRGRVPEGRVLKLSQAPLQSPTLGHRAFGFPGVSLTLLLHTHYSEAGIEVGSEGDRDSETDGEKEEGRERLAQESEGSPSLAPVGPTGTGQRAGSTPLTPK